MDTNAKIEALIGAFNSLKGLYECQGAKIKELEKKIETLITVTTNISEAYTNQSRYLGEMTERLSQLERQTEGDK